MKGFDVGPTDEVVVLHVPHHQALTGIPYLGHPEFYYLLKYNELYINLGISIRSNAKRGISMQICNNNKRSSLLKVNSQNSANFSLGPE